MNKKIVLLVYASILFLSCAETSLQFIEPVRAATTWTVDDDGPADFHTIQEAIDVASSGDSIFVYKGTYHEHMIVDRTLTLIGEDEESTIISGDGVGNVTEIVSDGVTMMAFTITNTPNSGITLRNVKDCNISRNILMNNRVGIHLEYSSYNTISGNNVAGNSHYGIHLEYSSNNIIARNNVTNSWWGIDLWESSYNTISGNNVVANGGHGINLHYSSNNLLRNNVMIDNRYNLRVTAYSLSEYTNDVDESNTVNEKPVYYWVNQSDKQIPLDAGYVIVVNSANITVRDLTLTSNGEGVKLVYTTDSVIQNVTVMNNSDGIMLHHQCQRNRIVANIVANNRGGIQLYYDCNDNLIYHNTIENNGEQAHSYTSTNEWDNGYEGNYWSDHNPPDEDLDGIGDVPYIIEWWKHKDRYPLIYPYGFVPKPDVNGDGIVNIIDIATVAKGFNTKPGDLHWNPIVDMDINEIINIVDVSIVALNYGKTV